LDGLVPADRFFGTAPDVRRALEAQVAGNALELARSGDAVVLSPACASFDMFRNYVHRAQVFLKAVSALAPSRVPSRKDAA
jgi:UDP-N-acetylmuramoylalanine--D-glutamate ligase